MKTIEVKFTIKDDVFFILHDKIQKSKVYAIDIRDGVNLYHVQCEGNGILLPESKLYSSAQEVSLSLLDEFNK